jgi:hypothetical protein
MQVVVKPAVKKASGIEFPREQSIFTGEQAVAVHADDFFLFYDQNYIDNITTIHSHNRYRYFGDRVVFSSVFSYV